VPDWSEKSTPNITWGFGEVPAANAKVEFTICHLTCSHMYFFGQSNIFHVQGIQHSRISHPGGAIGL
jgi:hypothetical protein